MFSRARQLVAERWASVGATRANDYIALPLAGSSSAGEEDHVDLSGLLPTKAARQTSHRKLLVAALVAAFLVASASLFSSTHLPSPFPSHKSDLISNPIRTRVGPRKFPSRYNRQGCNSSELIAAVGQAHVRSDGASRFEYQPPPGRDVNDIPLDTFQFSFDVEGCPAPHIFSPQEACDLVLAFGGIYNRGDSLMRQFAQGLFLLLANSFNLVYDKHEVCSGNDLFTNGMFCKFHSIFTSLDFAHVCEEQPYVMYDQVWKYISERQEGAPEPDYATPLLESYNQFIHALPPKRQQYSPILVEATGIHYRWRTEPTVEVHVKPFLANTSTVVPKPLVFWSGYPAVPANKPPDFMRIQGPEQTKGYNDAMRAILPTLSPGEIHEGAWRQLEWYNATEGGKSYDGTHYSYQVAMERAQIFLNVLDAVWGEIVAAGGLVE
ncbi:hypothetical protein JCM1840_004307 [Sporobolomyces johnsonii]